MRPASLSLRMCLAEGQLPAFRAGAVVVPAKPVGDAPIRGKIKT